MKSKKMITMVLAALSIAGGAMGAQAQTVEELSQEMDNRTNTLITAINNVATNLEGVQTNIETNLGNVAEMAQDGLDKANQKIDTNAGNITQNQQDIAENKQAIADEASQREAADQAIQTEMDTRTNNLIGAINTVATNLQTNLEGVQKNIETNLKDVADMAQDGLDEANQKIDTNAGNIKQNQQDIADNAAAIKKIQDNWSDSERAFNAETVQQIDANTKNIADEKEAREAADEVLQQGIDAETANRVAADNALDSRISHVETDANKGIAKATALAALHPLDYDPDNKFDVAAAGGFYKGEKAFALGAFYRPNRNMMVSLATSLSSGDNAYNVGVTFKVGKAGKRAESGVSTAELYAMIGAMQEKMDQQQKRIEELEANQAK